MSNYQELERDNTTDNTVIKKITRNHYKQPFGNKLSSLNKMDNFSERQKRQSTF